jgi:hypothetical protein
MYYQPWQRVFDVGFRIIVEIGEQVVRELKQPTRSAGVSHAWPVMLGALSK